MNSLLALPSNVWNGGSSIGFIDVSRLGLVVPSLVPVWYQFGFRLCSSPGSYSGSYLGLCRDSILV